MKRAISSLFPPSLRPLFCLLSVLAACSTDVPGQPAGGDAGDADAPGDALPEITLPFTDVQPEVFDFFGAETETIPGDAGGFGDWNKPCLENADCASGYCLEISDEESVCTITCVEECPKDWLCKGIQWGPDVVFICVPPGSECEPQEEICDGLDNNCDDVVDEGFSDLDGDGIADCVDEDTDGDGIDDTEDNCPEEPLPDQTDTDGDGLGDLCDEDADGDGTLDEEDCAPLDPGIHPDAQELCNGLDDNCNGAVDEGFADFDGDDLADCVDADDDGDFDPDESDCEPYDPDIHAGAPEACDGIDNDCDGLADEGCPAVAVQLEQVLAVVRGEGGAVRAAITLGRPVARTLVDEDQGIKLRLGASR